MIRDKTIIYDGHLVRLAGPIERAVFAVLARVITRTPECYGAVLPWGTYVATFEDGAYCAEFIIAHEVAHAKQRDRDGELLYWWRTFFYLAKFGYGGSPYEVEANKAAWTAYRARLERGGVTALIEKVNVRLRELGIQEIDLDKIEATHAG